MKAGDLVRVRDPAYLASRRSHDERIARVLYPWKFEVGVVLDCAPLKSFPGKEVYVHFPSHPMKSILIDYVGVINESR